MRKQLWYTMLAGVTLTSGLVAQNYPRQAAMVGGGDRDRGKCTIEVVVDGVAQVEVRGTSANLKTLSGQPAQWRRFECSGPLPQNPGDFRFAGVDGRGRQTLVRDPRSGGVAVVQIEDKDGGAEGYTFDLFWDMRGGGGGAPYRQDGPPPGRDESRRNSRGFGVDEAVRVCQDEVSRQASSRFRTNDIRFRRTAIDDAPGRNDWVTGSFEVRRPSGRDERFRFSCSVNFDSGRVRSANIDQRPMEDDRRR